MLQGLRWAALCGAFGTCIGSWIKVTSVQPDLFYVTFIGQSVVATSQVFMFQILNIFFKKETLRIWIC